VNRKPNLFIIGAMKSATSSLYNYLESHPDIFLSEVKEPMHFSRKENWSFGNTKYLGLFANATDEAYVGEGSTEYTKLPFREGVAKRLYDFSPGARLVYVIRDPMNRTVSQYKHMVNAGEEKRSLADAIKAPSDYLTNSYYAYQLRPYLELFGREAIFIDTSEALAESPVDFCRRIFRWLNIDESFIPQNLHRVYHASPTEFQKFDDCTLTGKAMLRVRQSPIANKIVPKSCRKWIARVLPRKFHVDFSSVDFLREVSIIHDAVSPILCSWIDELEKLTCLSFRIWPTHRISITGPTIPSQLTKEIEKSLAVILGKRRY
jgi:hypothetical protein